MMAASPRRRTSSMTAATTAATSAWVSRLADSSAVNSTSKPGSRLFSLSGTHSLPEAVDPALDLLVACLEGGAVDDETRRHVEDMLDLDQPIGLQRGAGGDQIDDALAEAQRGREFHGAVQLD